MRVPVYGVEVIHQRDYFQGERLKQITIVGTKSAVWPCINDDLGAKTSQHHHKHNRHISTASGVRQHCSHTCIPHDSDIPSLIHYITNGKDLNVVWSSVREYEAIGGGIDQRIMCIDVNFHA
jgi:hypothetical protein